MQPDFKRILEFFESMSLDSNAYFTLQSIEDFKVCTYYKKRPDGKNWSIWFDGHEASSKQTITSKYLQSVIDAFKIKEHEFMREISHMLLMQAAFADEFIRQTINLLGKEAVQKSILETQNFMIELSKCVDGVLNRPVDVLEKKEENKSRLRIIK